MVTAVVMAGGKGTRMGTATEKPLEKVFDKPMIIGVLDAISGSKLIKNIVVATSSNTPKTEELMKEFVCITEHIPSKCPNEIVAGVLNIFTKMDNILY